MSASGAFLAVNPFILTSVNANSHAQRPNKIDLTRTAKVKIRRGKQATQNGQRSEKLLNNLNRISLN